jgi:hypothetical protein
MNKRTISEVMREMGRKGGKKGGKKGGRARMKGLTEDERRELAKKGAAARWGPKKKS